MPERSLDYPPGEKSRKEPNNKTEWTLTPPRDTDGQFFGKKKKKKKKSFILLFTGSVEGVGAEQDAESRLKVESGAAAVGATVVDAVGELERVGPRVQDLFRRREDVARPQFKGRVLAAAVARLGRLWLHRSAQPGQQQQHGYRQTSTRHFHRGNSNTWMDGWME